MADNRFTWPSSAEPEPSTRRGYCAALIAALVRGVAAARAHELHRHRVWMIRAYAIGMGAATVSLIMFPIFVATGEPPAGLLSDLVFVGSWVINIAIGEWVIRRTAAPAPRYSRA